MNKKVAVLGAGSWGTALASVLVENNCDVTIWARRQDLVDEINHFHTNQRYLPNITLPTALRASASLSESIIDSEVVLFVVPSHAIRRIAQEVAGYISSNALIIHASKGFEVQSLKRISEVLTEELPQALHSRIVVLSGPSHAEEVIRQLPTTVVVSSQYESSAVEAQNVLINSTFRVYTSPDVIGVEVGGALKNIIGLAAGIVEGLQFGDNAKAALMTRGLAEIARLGTRIGANPLTFNGLSGVGDLIVTCTSTHSRNFRAGLMLSQGKTIQEILDDMGMVVEGIKTTKTAYTIAQKLKVEMPITEQLHQVLFANKEPLLAVQELMRRGKTGELGF